MKFHVDYKSDEGYKDYNGHKRHNAHKRYDNYDSCDSYNSHKDYGIIRKLPFKQGFQRSAHPYLKAPELAHLHLDKDLMSWHTLWKY